MNEVNLDDISDIKSIKIDKRKSKEERMLDFLSQVENPYVFKINGKLVKLEFTDNGTNAEMLLLML